MYYNNYRLWKEIKDYFGYEHINAEFLHDYYIGLSISVIDR